MSDFKTFKKYQEAVKFRDWQTCDLIADENKELLDEINKLQKALDVAMEAIDNIDIVFADDVEIIRQAKQKIQQILKGDSDE